MPKRIQRKRTKGWRMPDGAVYVGRPTRWGNPFLIGSNRPTLFIHDTRRVWWRTPRSHEALREAREQAVELYALHTGPMGNHELDVAEVRAELGGLDLACWCPLEDEQGNRVPCHADVLLEIANRGVA